MLLGAILLPVICAGLSLATRGNLTGWGAEVALFFGIGIVIPRILFRSIGLLEGRELF